MTAQAVLGFFGTVSSFSARGWYRFKRSADYDLYGYGSAGVYRREYPFLENESVLGLGIGVGVDVGLGRLFDAEEFPPIFANTEIGLTFANVEYYNFTPLSFGFGLHYRLGNP